MSKKSTKLSEMDVDAKDQAENVAADMAADDTSKSVAEKAVEGEGGRRRRRGRKSRKSTRKSRKGRRGTRKH